MYQHCPNPFAIKRQRKSVALSPKSLFCYKCPSSDLQCLPPDNSGPSANMGIQLLTTPTKS